MIQAGRSHIAKFTNCGVTGILTSLIIIFSVSDVFPGTLSAKNDTIFLKKGVPVYILGTIIIPQKDTIIVKRKSIGDEQGSKTFYDSIYNKFNKKKFSRFVYSLAFKKPPEVLLPDTQQIRRSQSPFSKYKGKIVRKITIVSLDPFGSSVDDTASGAKSGTGKFLNALHKKTYPYIIRNNLQIKKGAPVNDYILAENERYLRDLPYIHEVKTIIEPVTNSDSIDVTIITQDVWSIGFDLLTITPTALRMRLYDANFLGNGNRLSVNFSTELNRAPFYFLDGASYHLSNIWGTFIDVLTSFTEDTRGNQLIFLGAQRDFYSNQSQWAGGASFEYRKSVSQDKIPLTAYLDHEFFWIGKAWALEKENRPTRLVVLQSVNRSNFASRPYISLDSNRGYYNSLQILTGFAYSRNNHYLSDYLLEMGKVENIPYGNLFQINFGPESTDFYNRFYAGFQFSGGNFFPKFGYISASVSGGGYLHQKVTEDMVLKISTAYITPSITSPLKKYRFRSFIVNDFRMGFKQRTNNKETFNINNNFNIEKYGTDTVFLGTKSLSSTLSAVLYTPWYFYGFRFALIAQLQGGWVASQSENLFERPFYMGSGIGIMTKNNNLVFPALIISLFYYPGSIPGVPGWQVRFLPDAALKVPDFNPHVPGVENLQN